MTKTLREGVPGVGAITSRTAAENESHSQEIAGVDFSGLDHSIENACAEIDRLRATRDDLLACLRRMCGMYSAYSRRLAPLLAEDDGTIWTFERANSLALEAILKAEGK